MAAWCVYETQVRNAQRVVLKMRRGAQVDAPAAVLISPTRRKALLEQKKVFFLYHALCQLTQYGEANGKAIKQLNLVASVKLEA